MTPSMLKEPRQTLVPRYANPIWISQPMDREDWAIIAKEVAALLIFF